MGVHRRVTPWRRGRRIVLALLLLISGLAAAGPVHAKAPQDGPLRILLVGDSITQGSSGDLTWRWFLSQELAKREPEAKLVGPFTGVVRSKGQPLRTGVYADPDFQTRHAATWGDSFSHPLQDHIGFVRRYRPAVVVLMLGTNDIRKHGKSAEETANLTADWIQRARQAAPGVDIVVAQAPVTNNLEVADYNAQLAQLVADQNTAVERLVLAHTTAGYRMGGPLVGAQQTTPGATWDEVHPNGRGQQLIAAAVQDALATWNIGVRAKRPLAIAPETAAPWTQPVTIRTRSDRYVVRWSRPWGSTSADIRVKWGKGSWKRQGRALTGTRLVLPNKTCRSLKVQLRPRKGWTRAAREFSSPIVSASLPARCQR